MRKKSKKYRSPLLSALGVACAVLALRLKESRRWSVGTALKNPTRSGGGVEEQPKTMVALLIFSLRDTVGYAVNVPFSPQMKQFSYAPPTFPGTCGGVVKPCRLG